MRFNFKSPILFLSWLFFCIFLSQCTVEKYVADPTGFEAAAEAVEIATPDVQSTVAFTASPNLRYSRAGIGSIYTADNKFGSISDGDTSASLFEYIEQLYSDNYNYAVLYSIKNPFLMTCIVAQIAEKTGNILNNGTQSVEIIGGDLTECGTASDFSSLDQQILNMEISASPDTTYFDSYIVIEASANTFLTSNHYIYLRATETTLNFAHYHVDSLPTPSEYTATWVSWDSSTDSGLVQFVQENSYAMLLFRTFVDKSTNDARTFSHLNIYPGSSNYKMSMSTASVVQNQNQAAFSFAWENQIVTNSTDSAACLEVTSGQTQISTDNTRTCSEISKTAAAASGATSTSIVKAFTTNTNATYGTYAATPATGSLMMPQFDETNIVTSIAGW